MQGATSRFAAAIAVGVILGVCLMGLSAQAQSEGKAKAESVSVTGCLQKGQESGGYYIKDASDKMWELSSSTVKLSAHVGHQVTVTGTASKKSKAAEAKIEEHEKAEASGKPYGDLSVKSLKMVSESCQ